MERNKQIKKDSTAQTRPDQTDRKKEKTQITMLLVFLDEAKEWPNVGVVCSGMQF